MNSLPLHAQFDIVRLKLHLQDHPQDAHRLAIEHFQDYLEVVHRYQALEAQLQVLEAKPPSLPPFLTSSHSQLQQNYDELLESYVALQANHLSLMEENQTLLELLEFRSQIKP